MEFTPVIGIEIHVELKTKSKMFSSGPVTYGKKSNSQTVLFDLAYPGTMPTVNKEAVNYGIQIATALNMDIAKTLIFDRKNYFYSDLPKGFQITQQQYPIGSDGYLTIELDDGTTKQIGVERAHLEEDTAKQLHFPTYTLLNYNRAGTPLVEIVSRPEMHSAEEASKYVEVIHQIITFLGVSDGKMEEGSMRCDVNISLMEKGSNVFGTKVECKNLNSIANVRQAVDYEIKRQSELLEQGLPVIQETRRFNDSKGITEVMRQKSDAVDYKYFRENNIAPIDLSDSFVNQCIASMKVLPWEYKERFKELGLSRYEIGELLLDKENVFFFTSVLELGVKDPKILWNLLMGEIMSYCNKKEIHLNELEVNKQYICDLANVISSNKISFKQAKDVLQVVLNEGKDPAEVIAALGLEQVNDDKVIKEIVDKVLAENTQSIKDFLNGKDRALGYIVGQVMKASKGKVNPSIAKELVVAGIEEYKKNA